MMYFFFSDQWTRLVLYTQILFHTIVILFRLLHTVVCGVCLFPSGFHRPRLSDSHAGSTGSEKTIFTVWIPPWSRKVRASLQRSSLLSKYLMRRACSLAVRIRIFFPLMLGSVLQSVKGAMDVPSVGVISRQTVAVSNTFVNFLFILSFRPPERRHGYEQQYHSVTAQPEHEALEAKRPRMETVAEAHITRTPPTAGGMVLPMPHTVQDSLRATVEVKKVGLSCVFVLWETVWGLNHHLHHLQPFKTLS